VSELKGQKLFMGINEITASRTNTSEAGKERKPKNMMGLDPTEYELHKIDSDIAISYGQIDSWKLFKDFADRYKRLHREVIGNDRVRVGWHGKTSEPNTDATTNPNGEDVATGWCELARIADAGTGKHVQSGVTIGAGGDYANLDALISDGKVDLIAKPFRNAPNRVALISEDLIGMAEGKFYASAGNNPSEKTHLDGGRILQTYGGLRSITPPFFPDGTVIITTLNNLSIYVQENSWRRTLKDKPEKDEYQDFNSRNEGYVIEEPEAFGMIEGITAAPAA